MKETLDTIPTKMSGPPAGRAGGLELTGIKNFVSSSASKLSLIRLGFEVYRKLFLILLKL
jgi:hypothetical protein